MVPDVTLALLGRALSAAALRQAAIAHNLANIATPGFKRYRVEFEAELAQALAAGGTGLEVAPAVVREEATAGRPDGNNVDLELEMVRLAENQIWHAALVRQVSDHLARLRLAVFEGRR